MGVIQMVMPMVAFGTVENGLQYATYSFPQGPCNPPQYADINLACAENNQPKVHFCSVTVIRAHFSDGERVITFCDCEDQANASAPRIAEAGRLQKV